VQQADAGPAGDKQLAHELGGDSLLTVGGGIGVVKGFEERPYQGVQDGAVLDVQGVWL
jgi:hypothetical protein